MIPLACLAIALTPRQHPAPRLPIDGHSIVLHPSKRVTMKCLMDFPDGYDKDPTKKWPLMLFLHGAGERGSDVEKVRTHGPVKEVRRGHKLPFIIVAPQCVENELWDVPSLIALLDHVEHHYRVDKDREYLTGLSMGGFGTWELAAAQPGRFAAIAPVCGGGNWIKAWMLTKTPVWAVHGDADPVVPVDETRRMVDRLKALGNPEVKLTIVPGGGHDVWTDFYASDDIYNWFLQHKRS